MRSIAMACAMAAGAAGTALVAGPATAADYAPPPDLVYVPAPAESWTGFYMGLNAGWGWGDTSSVAILPADAAAAAFYSAPPLNAMLRPAFEPTASGFLGGAQMGVNYQLDSWLVGLEGDIAWSAMSGANVDYGQAGAVPFANSASMDLAWLSTLRARLGFASEKAMIYLTGGLALGGLEASYALHAPAANMTASGKGKGTAVGWTLGAGAEAMVADRLSMKAEVLYFNLEPRNFTVAGTGAATGNNFKAKADMSGWLARMGFNYHM